MAPLREIRLLAVQGAQDGTRHLFDRHALPGYIPPTRASQCCYLHERRWQQPTCRDLMCPREDLTRAAGEPQSTTIKHENGLGQRRDLPHVVSHEHQRDPLAPAQLLKTAIQ